MYQRGGKCALKMLQLHMARFYEDNYSCLAGSVGRVLASKPSGQASWGVHLQQGSLPASL